MLGFKKKKKKKLRKCYNNLTQFANINIYDLTIFTFGNTWQSKTQLTITTQVTIEAIYKSKTHVTTITQFTIEMK